MKKSIIATLFATVVAFLPQAAKAQNLSKEEAHEEGRSLVQEWKVDVRVKNSSIPYSNVVSTSTTDMPFWGTTYGEEPKDGYSLYISLHGGGGTTKEVNDGQWDNQKMLYTPSEGIYIAPRAPQDAWNMWFQPPLDTLYQTLIEYMVARYDVNPNRVYLLGYSAGGDGVWRMAPRMADRWAAASMMAGHPGGVSMLSLRNTPFMIWCGAEDDAYNRNLECKRYGTIMDSLHLSDPQGYEHETHIVEGKGHWMDRVDTAAISWMARHERNPYPERIVWSMGEVTHESFYWLSVPKGQHPERSLVRAERQGNTVTITESSYSELTIWLNDEMADLDKPVTIMHGSKIIFQGILPRTKENMRKSLWQNHDPYFMFPSCVTVKL